jgi:hypothetical protein
MVNGLSIEKDLIADNVLTFPYQELGKNRKNN